MYRYFYWPSCIYVWNLYVENYSSYRNRIKLMIKFSGDLDLWTSKCIGIFHSPSCIYIWNMKHVRWKLLTLSCQNQNVDKSSVVTLTFDLFTSKCKGIFLSPSCIFVWNMKVVRWELLKLSFQNQVVDKAQLWPWPLDPKTYRYLPITILHLYMKSVSWQNYSSYRVRTKVLTKFSCDLDLCTLICIGVLLSPTCMTCERWKLLKLSWQNQSVDKVQLWPWPHLC